MPPKRGNTRRTPGGVKKKNTRQNLAGDEVRSGSIELKSKNAPKSPKSRNSRNSIVPMDTPLVDEPVRGTLVDVAPDKSKRKGGDKEDSNPKNGLYCFGISSVVSLGCLVGMAAFIATHMGWLWGIYIGGGIAWLVMSLALILGRLLVHKKTCSGLNMAVYLAVFVPLPICLAIFMVLRDICIMYEYDFLEFTDTGEEHVLEWDFRMTTDNPDGYTLNTDDAYMVFAYTHGSVYEIIDTQPVDGGVQVAANTRSDFQQVIRFEGATEKMYYDCAEDPSTGKQGLLQIFTKAWGYDFEMVSVAVTLPCLDGATAGVSFLNTLAGGDHEGTLGPMGGACVGPAGWVIGNASATA